MTTQRQAYPSDLTEAEFNVIKPLLPQPKGGRPRKWPLIEILNAVFYVAQGDQRVEQAQRVGAAGYTDNHRLAVRDQLMLADRLSNLAEDIHRGGL